MGVRHVRELRDVSQGLGRAHLSVFQGDADAGVAVGRRAGRDGELRRGPREWRGEGAGPLLPGDLQREADHGRVRAARVREAVSSGPSRKNQQSTNPPPPSRPSHHPPRRRNITITVIILTFIIFSIMTIIKIFVSNISSSLNAAHSLAAVGGAASCNKRPY